MTDYSAPMKSEVSSFISKYGEMCRIKFYTEAYATGSYDDMVTLTLSGTAKWVSGLPQPVTGPEGSSEARLLKQGAILHSDTKLYITGSIATSGNNVKIGIGSASTMQEFSILPDGVQSPAINGSIVYKKVYCRYLTNGSLAGE